MPSDFASISDHIPGDSYADHMPGDSYTNHVPGNTYADRMPGDFSQGLQSPSAEGLWWKVVLRQELYFFPVSSLVLRSCKLSAGVLGFMLEEGMRAEQVAPPCFSP